MGCVDCFVFQSVGEVVTVLFRAAFWDDKAGDIKDNKSVDISIAVATDKV